MKMLWPLQWAVLALPSLVLALQLGQDDLCYVEIPRVAITDHALYFMGGKYTLKGGDTNSREQTLFAIPLNSSFPTTGVLPANNYRYVQSPSSAGIEQGAFFMDANASMLYSFAGFNDPSNPTSTVLAFNTTSEEWSNVTVSGGQFNFDAREASLNAVTEGTDEGLGFFTGGWEDVPGMIRFDASDPAKLKWTNETNNNPPLTQDGGMEFTRFGKQGSLIAFGGYNKDYIQEAFEPNWSYDHRPMSQIGVYDIQSSTWYNVTAVGDVPSNRSAFCTAISAAPDDSSFQITVYGGFDLFKGVSFEDVYALSVPSFEWINVTDTTSTEIGLNGGHSVGRNDHKCKAFKDREMLSIGGDLIFGNKAVNQQTCNSSWPVVRTLDLSTYKWMDHFDPNPGAYVVPDQVYRVIGGGGNGSATMKQPSAGFGNSDLNALFAQVLPRSTPYVSASGGNPSSASSMPSGSGADLHHKKTAAIVGGVVGGVVVLGLVGGAILFFCRRRRGSQVVGNKMELDDAAPGYTRSELENTSWQNHQSDAKHVKLPPNQMPPVAEAHGTHVSELPAPENPPTELPG